MSQALYRRYRSRGFDEVVGQRHVTDLLASAIKSGAISHAYLFTGPRGTGKTSVARIVAHEINELPYTEDSTHLDIIEIDAASNRRIDDIRDLREKVYIAPTSAKYKVYIIDEVHMLTGESFNALLKTLEEPPAHTVFILATTELHKVPATIISRTQRFHFRPGTVADVAGHLRMIASKEKIAIEDDALTLIAEHSEGGFRDSVSLLDQVASIGKGTITADTVESLLGLAPKGQIDTIVETLINNNAREAVQLIQSLMTDGMSPTTIITQLTTSLSRYAPNHPELYSLLFEIIELPKSFAPHLKLLALIGSRVTSETEKSLTSQADNEISRAPAPKETKLASPLKQSSPQAKSTANIKPEPTIATTPIDTASPVVEAVSTQDISWNAVLAEAQKRAPALYSILKRAVVDVTPERITLNFSFSLHRKKMNDDKQRRELISIITNLYGSCPHIDVTDGKPKLDETAATVADIMGGGESVAL